MDLIPRSQHRPIGIQIHAAVVPTTVPFRRRFNYRKANWEGFTQELDHKVKHIRPLPENYCMFTKVVQKAARRNIPRGCRVNYIPGLTSENAELHNEYITMFESDPFSEETIAAGEQLMINISQERRNTWNTLIEKTDMSKNSKKAWALIRKLGGDPKKTEEHCNTTADQVAHQLLLNGKGPRKRQKAILDRKKYCAANPGFTSPFTMTDLETGIHSLKPGKAVGLDNIATEQIKYFGQQAKVWLLNLYNNCMTTHKLPKIWLKTRVLALLKPGKDPSDPKSFRPISLLCHTYKLFERLILNRIAPSIDQQIIPEQAGFRPGKSTTSQLVNLTQHIEDGFERGQITGAVLVDLSAAYDTVNHRRLLCKILEITKDIRLTELMEIMLQNRRFYVELGGNRSRWRNQKNGLPQGSVLAPLQYNIYTNDQPRDDTTHRFIYADDLCITAQGTDFISIEETLTEALSGLTTYYEENHLRANPAKTQVCAFHLRNKEAKRQLNVSWSGTPLSHLEHPVYLGVTLDRCLTFKTHLVKTKAKVSARNNILRKLTNTRWGACPQTLRATALALCFSTAEYACPAWERSTHAKKLDPVLNESCRCITGCLKPTNINNLYILAGIAPPDIRRAVASMTERRRQATDERHPLHGHVPAPCRLKSRKSFLSSTTPLETTPSEARLVKWKEKLSGHLHSTTMPIPAAESLPPGDSNWAKWKCLNRLRTGVGRSKELLRRWGYLCGPTTCDCGTEPQTMEHLLQCPLQGGTCTAEDLALYNNKAQQCVNHWMDVV